MNVTVEHPMHRSKHHYGMSVIRIKVPSQKACNDMFWMLKEKLEQRNRATCKVVAEGKYLVYR